MSLRRKLALAFGIAFFVLLMCAATIGAVVWWEAHTVVAELQSGPKKKIVRAVEPVLKQKPKRTLVPAPPEAGAQTILLIGSDRRVPSQGQPGARSDTTIVVRIDPKRHRIGLLSIPRDLYVEIPGHGHDRINAAFEEGGEKLLTRTVRDTLGLKIDHFVEVDFRGFRKIVHDLGGIWLPIDQRYYNQNLHTPGTNYAAINLGPGYQRLNGGQALEFARYRHYDSDLYRAARQQLVIRETLRQSFAHKLDFFRIVRLAHDFADATTSDIDSVRELWGLANAVRGARVDRVTIDVSDFTAYGADYLTADDAQLKAAVRALFGLPPARVAGTTRTIAAAPSAAAPATSPSSTRTEAARRRCSSRSCRECAAASRPSSRPATAGRTRTPRARTRSTAIRRSRCTRRPARATRSCGCSRRGATRRSSRARPRRARSAAGRSTCTPTAAGYARSRGRSARRASGSRTRSATT